MAELKQLSRGPPVVGTVLVVLKSSSTVPECRMRNKTHLRTAGKGRRTVSLQWPVGQPLKRAMNLCQRAPLIGVLLLTKMHFFRGEGVRHGATGQTM